MKRLPSDDPTIHCVLMKKGKKINRPSLIIIPFKIYLESFLIQKLNFAGNLLLANRCSIFFNDKPSELFSVTENSK